MRSLCARLLGGTLVLLFFAGNALPQASTAPVSGTVRDQSDAVLPGATLTLTNTATNVKVDTTTNTVGFFFFPGIIAGPYRLECSAPGMDRFQAALEVSAGQKLTVDPVLKAGSTTTVVAVTDVTPLVNVTGVSTMRACGQLPTARPRVTIEGSCRVLLLPSLLRSWPCCRPPSTPHRLSRS